MIDLHCDTILRLMNHPTAGGLRRNNFHVDLEKLKKAGSLAQVFAAFVFKTEGVSSYDTFMKLRKVFLDQISANSDMVEQVTRVKPESDKIQAVFSIEEGDVLEGKMERVQEVASYGVRLIALTWNFENEIGFPNSSDPDLMAKGLKPFGLDLIPEMERNHIIVDVSHLSEGGFWDVARTSTKPFVASHSNCRELCPVSRNLSDKQIRALAECGGVMGLNFYSQFLGEEKTTTLENLVRHVLHAYNVGGRSVLALGTDYDGIDCELELPDISYVPRLRDALSRAGLVQSVLDDMWHNNAMRVLSF